MGESDQLINLRNAMASYRAWLQEQLAACESGKFQLRSFEGGQWIDTTVHQITDLKRQIAEHDRLLGDS